MLHTWHKSKRMKQAAPVRLLRPALFWSVGTASLPWWSHTPIGKRQSWWTLSTTGHRQRHKKKTSHHDQLHTIWPLQFAMTWKHIEWWSNVEHLSIDKSTASQKTQKIHSRALGPLQGPVRNGIRMLLACLLGGGVDWHQYLLSFKIFKWVWSDPQIEIQLEIQRPLYPSRISRSGCHWKEIPQNDLEWTRNISHLVASLASLASLANWPGEPWHRPKAFSFCTYGRSPTYPARFGKLGKTLMWTARLQLDVTVVSRQPEQLDSAGHTRSPCHNSAKFCCHHCNVSA